MSKRYEFHDSGAGSKGSHKFWEICETKGGQTRVRWGRVGTSGQEGWYDNSVVAEREQEKRGKGYRLVGGTPKQEPEAKPEPKPKAKAPKVAGSAFTQYLQDLKNGTDAPKEAPKAAPKAKPAPVVAPAPKPSSDELEKILNSVE